MTVRPIDGNKPVQSLKNRRLHILMENENDGTTVFDDIVGWIKYTPTLPSPNELLTIEQLREMDGEPVWIVDVGPHKWYGPCWAIVERDNCLVRTAKSWNPVFFKRYGERWLAYRRPLEGEENNND